MVNFCELLCAGLKPRLFCSMMDMTSLPLKVSILGMEVEAFYSAGVP